MAGTKIGGAKAAETNRLRHGDDFYKLIGSRGGKISKGGGFKSDRVGSDGLTGRERASLAGRKGGRRSRRGPSETVTKKRFLW